MSNLEWVRKVTAAGFTIDKEFNRYIVHDASGKQLASFKRRYEAQAYLSKRVGVTMHRVEKTIADAIENAATERASEMADYNAERVAAWRPPTWEGRLPTELGGHAVYRAIAPDGEVLYVGVTNSLWKRMGDHRRQSAWWDHAAEIDWVIFATREKAEREEKRAIRRHRPRFNIVFAS